MFQSSAFAQEKEKDKTVTDTTNGKIIEKKANVAAPETKKEKAIEKKQRNKLYSVGQFGHETTLIAKQPTKWGGKDWLKLGIVVGATFAAMPFDESITNTSRPDSTRRYYYNPFIVGGRVYGEWYSILGVSAIFGIYGLVADDTSSKKITIELFQAGAYAEAVTEVFKIIVGRERPIATENSFTFHPFSIKYDFESMPSGHATAAFALSTVMSRHANTTFLKILAYVPAGFTMFSRIYQHQHWLSDEIPGAAVGYFVGNWVVDLHEGKAHRINVTSMYPLRISYSLDKASAK